jgi:hypothetical protein
VSSDYPPQWPGPASDYASLNYAPRHRKHRRWPLITGIAAGAVLVLARLILPAWPIHGHTFNEVNGMCSGAIGAFLQGLGGKDVQQACSEVHTIFFVANLAAIAGAITAGACAWVLWHRTRKTGGGDS